MSQDRVRTRRPTVVAAGALAAAGLLAVSIGLSGPSRTGTAPDKTGENAGQYVGAMPRGGTVPVGTPCPSATHISLEGARSAGPWQPEQFSAPAYLPDQKVAAATDAWICGPVPSPPVIMFDSVQATFEGDWTREGASSNFQGLLKQNGGEIRRLASPGVDAYLLDAPEGDPERNAGLLALAPDGTTMLSLFSNKVRSAEELVPLASSILENFK